ncbi:fructosamine kinase family protein [Evansella clarkii]|uniref:fructosamine kinase family protein n=1 Tax=Evansella clarkii TaxID=79879 RepID=UPI000B4532B6|nr:fructosamine kinase family protein [Evansella clarkii]
MENVIRKAIKAMGDKERILNIKKLSGGDINEAFYAETEKKPYFLKLNRNVSAEFFQSEKDGLLELQTKGGVYVPEVYGLFEGTGYNGLILEWIEERPENNLQSLLGEAIARLHGVTAERFGYRSDTYIGEMKQENGWWENWVDYYREKRLIPQLEQAAAKDLLLGKRRTRAEYIAANLEKWIPAQPVPALLHGDLWSGNWMSRFNGEPVFIDPSVFYGHNKMEIAFTELFGGFSAEFYEAYSGCKPLDQEYDNRKELYQLFYLLVHLNSFGEMYRWHVDKVIQKYTV